MKAYPSYSTLVQVFEYKNGHLFWKKPTGPRASLNRPAGFDEVRYRSVKLNNKTYKVHRLIWILHYGTIPLKMVIDHIDGNGFNNVIENLRLVSCSQNQCNQVNRKHTSKLGIRGVYRHGKKYAATITIEGKSKHLGCFLSIEDASAAYQAAFKDYQNKLAAKNDELEARLAALEQA